MKTRRILSLFALSALVAACGGGGDSGPAQSTAIPLATAMASQINQNKSGSVSIAGTVTAAGQTVNVSGSGAYAESTVAATFEGIPGLRKHIEVTGSVSASGVSAPISSASDAYYDSNYTYRVTSGGVLTRLADTLTVSVNGASFNLTITQQ